MTVKLTAEDVRDVLRDAGLRPDNGRGGFTVHGGDPVVSVSWSVNPGSWAAQDPGSRRARVSLCLGNCMSALRRAGYLCSISNGSMLLVTLPASRTAVTA